ncbi:ABC transporter substrate-binding protein [Aquabacterium sp.]|uniref:ABC transporter substrate-binding protein n=1 Tax=Aquabacterium sp. TaxID=1872578 RepID=UPI00263728D7|nr:ABC transporter substrate-binding protein [Aquabacterium sp.]MDD2978012.1 ABC transporter substrate-binding protein [Aquabacterium sp.]
MTFRTIRPWVSWLLLLVGALSGLIVAAGEVQDRVLARKEMKVCIWPDYQRISFRDPRSGQLSGLDIDLAAALASSLNVKLKFINSSFVTLVEDLHTNRCDVAMFGIAMLPQRMEQLQFATPYLQSDIYAVTTRTSRIVRQWSDIDRPGVLVGVQAGTFMEPVMRQRLRHADLVPIQLPQTRERELIAGRVDVFMTDYPYGRALLENADWAALLASPNPFHVLPYAHASKPGDTQWLATLNAFVARIRQDGYLDAAARRYGLESIVLR